MRRALPGLTLTAAVALLLAACLPRPKSQPEMQLYDFGPPTATTSAASATPLIVAPVVVRPPEAPLWLDSPAVFYRLAYDEPARIRTYAFSRWIASPVRLLGDMLRRRVAEASATVIAEEEEGAAAHEHVLHLQLEEFSQVFDSRQESRVVVRARATLLRHATREVAAQRAFAIERPAPSADGAGAVQGLADASRELTDEVVAWLAEILPRVAPRPAAPVAPAPEPPRPVPRSGP